MATFERPEKHILETIGIIGNYLKLTEILSHPLPAIT